MGLRRLVWAGALALAAAVVISPAQAQEGPNSGRVSLSVSSDITNAYFFRGILQERDGLIWQPAVDLGFNLYSGDGMLSSVDLGAGMWVSYHEEETLASGGGADPLYEVDYYPSLSVSLSNGISTGLTYYLYTSPNGAFRTAKELSWSIGYDDSDMLMEGFSLQPAVEFAFELDNTILGNGEGIFVGLGVEPAFDLLADTSYPLSISIPLTLGLSADEYFYDPSNVNGTGATDDDTFGFFTFGFTGSVPLAFIPEDFGAWSTSLGVDVYVLNDDLERINEGDSPYPVVTWNVSMAY